MNAPAGGRLIEASARGLVFGLRRTAAAQLLRDGAAHRSHRMSATRRPSIQERWPAQQRWRARGARLTHRLLLILIPVLCCPCICETLRLSIAAIPAWPRASTQFHFALARRWPPRAAALPRSA